MNKRFGIIAALLLALGVLFGGCAPAATAAPAAPTAAQFAQAQAMGFPAGSFVSSTPQALPALDAAVSAPILSYKASSTKACWAGNRGHVTSSVSQQSSTSASYKITAYKPSWYTNWVRAYFDGVGKNYANSTIWVNVPNHAIHTIRIYTAAGDTCAVSH